MLTVGNNDAFEFDYMHELHTRLGAHGLLLNYENDRAALDIGLHLYTGPLLPDRSRNLSGVRVWFQAKGIQTTTLSAQQVAASKSIPVTHLSVEHVRYWYAAAEPVYLVAYLQATNEFLAADVRQLVDDTVGDFDKLLSLTQHTMTLAVPTSATLDAALDRMPSHRSMRVDGPPFRGRPLGHRYDPLRSELAPMDPSLFVAVVDRLLDVHDFRTATRVDTTELSAVIGTVRASSGTMGLTYEWTSPLFTEYGYGPGSDLRLESPPFHLQEHAFVVVHADRVATPAPDHPAMSALRAAKPAGTPILVFANGPDDEILGAWRHAFDDLRVIPQGLGSLAFNVLTATTVYLEFVDQLSGSS